MAADRQEARTAACVQDETAAWAFADALLALQELGHADVAERLRGRWADVEAPERYARPP